MEKERISIVSQVDYSDIKWLAEREKACLSTLFMYSKISETFRIDSAYGSKFVSENQELIGRLVQAAMQEVHANTLSKAIEIKD